MCSSRRSILATTFFTYDNVSAMSSDWFRNSFSSSSHRHAEYWGQLSHMNLRIRVSASLMALRLSPAHDACTRRPQLPMHWMKFADLPPQPEMTQFCAVILSLPGLPVQYLTMKMMTETIYNWTMNKLTAEKESRYKKACSPSKIQRVNACATKISNQKLKVKRRFISHVKHSVWFWFDLWLECRWWNDQPPVYI